MLGVIKIMMILLAGYSLLLIITFFFQRHLLFFPDTRKPVPWEWSVPEMQAVMLTTEDNLSLLSWYHPPSNKKVPTLVFFHGNAGHIGYRGWMVRPFIDAGYGVLLVSYRGFGSNPGKPTEHGLYRDGEAAMAFLREQGITPACTILLGESLGSGVAAHLAARYPVGGLVLYAPFTSLVDVAKIHYPWALPQLLLQAHFPVAADLKSVTVPLLVIHGEKDRIVPAPLGKALFNGYSGEEKVLQLIPDAGHNDLEQNGASERVKAFLSTHPPCSN